MSATEEDTELRDLLIQNLENSGVLNRIKAELRAAVFLALEEQQKQDKQSLENECLKKCVNTKDGRLAASLIADFLKSYNLDFTLAVFQPEINIFFDGRDTICRDLGIQESDGSQSCPVLPEVIRKCQQKEKSLQRPFEEMSSHQIAEAQKKFEAHSKDKTTLKAVELMAFFADFFPLFSRSMLECYVNEELARRKKHSNVVIDFQEVLGMLRRFFMQCRSVVMPETGDIPHTTTRVKEHKLNSQLVNQMSEIQTQPLITEISDKVKAFLGRSEDEDEDEGDSFFDDPLPKPQKIYGSNLSSAEHNLSEKSTCLRDKLLSSSSECRLMGKPASKTMLQYDKPADREDGHVNYDDDFNSHRSDVSHSEISIGEEIEEGSLEGPDFSEKVDGSTVDVSVSSRLSEAADYLEDVS